MYQVYYYNRVEKFLRKIPKKEMVKLLDKISLLTKDPFTQALDIKKLATTKHSYRLRMGTLRVIYEINTPLKRIYIQEVGFRGSIY